MQADTENRGNLDVPGDDVAQLMQTIAQVIINVKNLPAGFKESFAFPCEGEVSSAPFYKSNFEAVFQSPNLLANSTLGNITKDGGLGKATSFDEVAKDFEGFDLHGSGKNKID